MTINDFNMVLGFVNFFGGLSALSLCARFEMRRHRTKLGARRLKGTQKPRNCWFDWEKWAGDYYS